MNAGIFRKGNVIVRSLEELIERAKAQVLYYNNDEELLDTRMPSENTRLIQAETLLCVLDEHECERMSVNESWKSAIASFLKLMHTEFPITNGYRSESSQADLMEFRNLLIELHGRNKMCMTPIRYDGRTHDAQMFQFYLQIK